MTIDLEFINGNSREPRPAAVARQIKAAPSAAKDRKVYEDLAEARMAANKYKRELDAALSALSLANSEVDRLKAELAAEKAESSRLGQELDKARQKKSPAKGGQKPKKQQADSPAETAEPAPGPAPESN